MMHQHIFSYGSNLLLARLTARVPSARFIARGELTGHTLRWHKAGRDGSGKCDAFFTGDPADRLWGGVFEIASADKHLLDAIEGLGSGYDEKHAEIECLQEGQNPFVRNASFYTAVTTNPDARPFAWYKAFVVAGARECGLPTCHLETLRSVAAVRDPDRPRDAGNRALLPRVFKQKQMSGVTIP